MKCFSSLNLQKMTFLSFGILFCVWGAVTYSGFVDPLFLPKPDKVLQAGHILFAEENFTFDVMISTWRVLLGFGLSCILGIPLGIWIGTSKKANAIFTPMISFIRYMPAPAFIPLLILWLGIGIGTKIALIFMSVFFYLTPLVADSIRNVDEDCIETAMTLGANKQQILFGVIMKAASPRIWQSMRIMMGVAWTSIIIVELIAAQRGIGAMIIRAQRFLQTPKIIVGIIIIGILGIIFDALFQLGTKLMFPWVKHEGVNNGS